MPPAPLRSRSHLITRSPPTPANEHERAVTAPHDCTPFLDEPTRLAPPPAELENIEVVEGVVPHATPSQGARRIAHTFRRPSTGPARVPPPPPLLADGSHAGAVTASDTSSVLGDDLVQAIAASPIGKITFDDLPNLVEPASLPPARPAREPSVTPVVEPTAEVRAPRRDTHLLVGLAILLVALGGAAVIVTLL